MTHFSNNRITHPLFRAVTVWIPLVLLPALVGCSLNTATNNNRPPLESQPTPRRERPAPPAQAPPAATEYSTLIKYLNLKGRRLQTKISHLESLASGQAEGANHPELLFYLALLYSSPHNPRPDYGKALTRIKAYHQAADEKTAVKHYILKLLTVAEQRRNGLEKQKSQSSRLTQTHEKLKSEIDKLTCENLSLKQAIEKLKRLDIRLEKKRESID